MFNTSRSDAEVTDYSLRLSWTSMFKLEVYNNRKECYVEVTKTLENYVDVLLGMSLCQTGSWGSQKDQKPFIVVGPCRRWEVQMGPVRRVCIDLLLNDYHSERYWWTESWSENPKQQKVQRSNPSQERRVVRGSCSPSAGPPQDPTVGDFNKVDLTWSVSVIILNSSTLFSFVWLTLM